MTKLGATVLLSLSLLTSAPALVINGGTASNASDPGAGLPWGNVGAVAGGTGIYLGTFGGSYWMLTAAHVGAANVTLGSTTYNWVPGSAIRVLNGDNSNTDLLLFRLASDPGLSNLTLAAAAPTIGSQVVLIGRGLTEGAVNYWHVTVNAGQNNDVWTDLGSNSSGANAAGFFQSASTGQRWGTNTISGTTTYNVGTGVTTALYTDFSNLGGEAQGASGDSGGALFYYDGGNWLLAGVLGAIANYENQPGSTTLLGQLTYAADIATYDTFITSAIPEPSTWASLLGAAALAGVAWQRRRS